MMKTNLTYPIDFLQPPDHLYEMALDAIADGVIFINANRQIQWCNRAFTRLVNASNSMIGFSFREILPLEIAPEDYPDLRLRQGIDETTEYSYESGDRILNLEIAGSVIQLSETEKPVILTLRDITRLKQLETEYQQKEISLQESEERFRTFFGKNVVGTIVPETETSGRDLQRLMEDICQHPENYLFNENCCKNGDRVWIVWANKPILVPKYNPPIQRISPT
ncbi:MAG: PAS domain-containing protein [Chroococcales cyanobacterium]